jgi:hypothetical protein
MASLLNLILKYENKIHSIFTKEIKLFLKDNYINYKIKKNILLILK